MSRGLARDNLGALPVLNGWLAPHDFAWFLRTHFDRTPFATAGTAASAVPLFGWDTLDRVLASPHPLDLLTVTRGELVPAAPPRRRDDVQRLMEKGVSVVVRGAEAHDPALRALADEFEGALDGETRVQLYVTPGNTNSFGWHYDFEHVFVAQTAGAKDYYFRANTVARDTALGDPLDFTVIRRETSPIFSARLLAGDWLYIPARWWHLVKCSADALSISVGVMPPGMRRPAR